MSSAILQLIVIPLTASWQAHGSIHAQRHGHVRIRSDAIGMALPAYVPQADIDAISEPAAVEAIGAMQTASLELTSAVASGPVDVTYLKTSVATSDEPPLLLVHGFDISSLEYRRLLPQLEAAGIEAYAPCIAGWGFTATSNLKTVGVPAKREQLLAFHEQVLGGRPAVWVGASLGGCIALDCYQAKPAAFVKLVALDPGFFTEAPPAVPPFVGRLLLQNVLSAPAVRASIAKQAYSVKELQTDDAIRCGNLHLNRPEWEEDSLEWLLGGAYGGIEDDVSTLAALPTLTLWGRNDQVIPPDDAVPKLVAALPDATFRWVETSGHTPHLEQPAVTAEAIVAFVRGGSVAGDGDVAALVSAYETREAIKSKAVEVGQAVAEQLGALGKQAAAKAKEMMEGQR